MDNCAFDINGATIVATGELDAADWAIDVAATLGAVHIDSDSNGTSGTQAKPHKYLPIRLALLLSLNMMNSLLDCDGRPVNCCIGLQFEWRPLQRAHSPSQGLLPQYPRSEAHRHKLAHRNPMHSAQKLFYAHLPSWIAGISCQ